MIEVVAEDEVVAVDVLLRREGEFEAVEVVFVRWGREVGACGGGIVGFAAVVLDADAELRG